jgi:hypothetical protein
MPSQHREKRTSGSTVERISDCLPRLGEAADSNEPISARIVQNAPENVKGAYPTAHLPKGTDPIDRTPIW